MSLLVYKLDSAPEQAAICALSKGEHPIGRGPLLQCTDRRASTHQALIKVEAKSSSIRSTHSTPCFYQSAQSKTIIILPQNSPIDIQTGDKFGLFPDKYWFKFDFKPENMSEQGGHLKRPAESSTDVIESKQPKLADIYHDDNNIKEELESQKMKGNSDNGTISEGAEGKNGRTDDVAIVSDSLFERGCIEEETLNGCEVGNNQENFEGGDIGNIEKDSTGNIEDDNTENNTASDSQVTNLKEELSDSESDNNKESKTDKPSLTKREKCWYGSGCYRKNTKHRDQFSHPGDADYVPNPDDDNRPTCSYGASCYRRNKDHRKEYKHTAKPAAKKRKRKGAAKQTAVHNDETSEDDYDYDDPFLDDGSEDEYEEESWSEDDSDADWGGDSQNLSEDEDTTRNLLKEAKRFTKK